MLKAWTKSAKLQCLCGFSTLSYYNALVDSSHNSSGFQFILPPEDSGITASFPIEIPHDGSYQNFSSQHSKLP